MNNRRGVLAAPLMLMLAGFNYSEAQAGTQNTTAATGVTVPTQEMGTLLGAGTQIASTGTFNTQIGFSAGTLANGSQNILIGASGSIGVNGDQMVNVGASIQSAPYYYIQSDTLFGQGINTGAQAVVDIGQGISSYGGSDGSVQIGANSFANYSSGAAIAIGPNTSIGGYYYLDSAAIVIGANGSNYSVDTVQLGDINGTPYRITNISDPQSVNDALTNNQFQAWQTAFGGISGTTNLAIVTPFNTFIGYNAAASSTGSYNLDIGFSAGWSLTGDRNVALGQFAGYTASGNDNTFLGESQNGSGQGANGNENIGFGGGDAFAGAHNHGIGLGAYSHEFSQGEALIGLGANAIYEDFASDRLIAIGSGSATETQGVDDTVIGEAAGNKNYTSNRLVAIGKNSGYPGSGDDNVYIGNYSGGYDTGNTNISLGTLAAQSVTGDANIAVGLSAGDNPNTSRTIAIGTNTQGSANDVIAFGTSASAGNANAVALGVNAIAVGANSLAFGSGAVNGSANAVTFGAAGQPLRLVNIAPGVALTDAVNIAELSVVSGLVDAASSQVISISGSLNSSAGVVNTLSGTVNSLGTSVAGISGTTNTLAASLLNVSGATDTATLNIGTISGAINTAFSYTAPFNLGFGYQAASGVTGSFNTALGYSAGVSVVADNAVALGRNSGVAGGQRSISIGLFAQSSADDGIALGAGAQAAALNSVSVGTGAIDVQPNSVQFGSVAQPLQLKNLQPGISPSDGTTEVQLTSYSANVGAILSGFSTTVNNDATIINAVANGSTVQNGGSGSNGAPGNGSAGAPGRGIVGLGFDAQNNIGLGTQTGDGLRGSDNVFYGTNTGLAVSGQRNVGLGAKSLINSTGEQTLALGAAAGTHIFGANTIAVGASSGASVIGDENALVGISAGQHVEGGGNSAFGAATAVALTGALNTVAGASALNDVSGQANIAFGAQSGNRITGNANIAIGAAGAVQTQTAATAAPALQAAVQSSVFGPALGNENIAIGRNAGITPNTPVFHAVAVGTAANVSADDGIAFGTSATAGGSAVALGSGSLAGDAQSISLGAPANLATSAISRRIVQAADGISDSDAATIRQLGVVAGDVSALDTELQHVATHANSGTAQAIAQSSAAAPVKEPGKTHITVGQGYYNGAAAIAVGALHTDAQAAHFVSFGSAITPGTNAFSFGTGMHWQIGPNAAHRLSAQSHQPSPEATFRPTFAGTQAQDAYLPNAAALESAQTFLPASDYAQLRAEGFQRLIEVTPTEFLARAHNQLYRISFIADDADVHHPAAWSLYIEVVPQGRSRQSNPERILCEGTIRAESPRKLFDQARRLIVADSRQLR